VVKKEGEKCSLGRALRECFATHGNDVRSFQHAIIEIIKIPRNYLMYRTNLFIADPVCSVLIKNIS
jgi:hypothetical protein